VIRCSASERARGSRRAGSPRRFAATPGRGSRPPALRGCARLSTLSPAACQLSASANRLCGGPPSSTRSTCPSWYLSYRISHTPRKRWRSGLDTPLPATYNLHRPAWYTSGTLQTRKTQIRGYAQSRLRVSIGIGVHLLGSRCPPGGPPGADPVGSRGSRGSRAVADTGPVAGSAAADPGGLRPRLPDPGLPRRPATSCRSSSGRSPS
jgi:hypothetical protein